MMNKKKEYTGIDKFRFVAALLVIAIHTSPLAAYNETGNFILTRIAARVAVPFFMMTSGYFLISRYAYNTQKLKSFIKKTAIIYGCSILLYLPVNIYNGYFSMEPLLPELIKDIIFDGTMYHLWYLPASMLGAGIAWRLARKFEPSKALLIACVLYGVGLFGDSYYGITENIPVLQAFYRLVFQITDYTRNGVFFSPIFFLLGGRIADRSSFVSPPISVNRRTTGAKHLNRKYLVGFGISVILLLAEAMLLRQYNILSRHDSMYLFLLPCMYFLFHLILQWNHPSSIPLRHIGIFRKNNKKHTAFLRTASLFIYIIHPMMIVVVRMIAKALHLEKALIENSMIHYVAVCVASIAFSMAAAAIWNKYQIRHTAKIKNRQSCPDTDRAWIELNTEHLKHNVNALQEAMPKGCNLMAVVKDNAYGHGAFEVSTQLNKVGVKAFAVATIEEGIRLRNYGIQGEILILGYTNPNRAKELKKYKLTQTLIDFAYARALNRQGILIEAHIKIDTGMHRLGLSGDSFLQIKNIFAMRHISVTGIYTHLCCADSLEDQDVAFTRKQMDKFYYLIHKLKENGIGIPKLHIQSSYGLLNYPDVNCDYVRAGIALYGVLSAPNEKTLQKLELQPALSLKTRIILIRCVLKGESIGYGGSYLTKRDSLIAILPIGYGDGIPRNLSGKGSGAVIRGQFAPIVGRICMDLLMVDITEIKDAATGDIATLICSEQRPEVSAPTVAKQSGSISNELLCRLGSRLPVITR